MSVHRRRIGKHLTVATVICGLVGCAFSERSHIDVSAPTNREFIEFDAQVDVSPATAYQNILSLAPACWCSPFSGQVLAYANPAANGSSRISLVVPGKFLGSKVELATVDLYPEEGNRTRIIGTSSVYPGTWHLDQLADWANGMPNSCLAPDPA